MNLFEIAAKLTLNSSEFDSGLKSAAGKVGSFASGAAKAGIAAVGAAATAVSAIVKKSVDAYGEYEQLLGGIRKLYDTETSKASARVEQYARNAYKTVGMSQNQYMRSTTAFTAKLISDFGGNTVHAADYADKAMRQIADNANTFGKYTVDELTGVYQALARGSYMTLDNLSLGFSGTKQGMEELLKAAQEVTGVKYDINNFSDVIDAIGVIQKKLKIAGTSQKEIISTLQGSMSSFKAAWENLLIGFATEGADVNELIDELIDSGTSMAKNMLPTIERAIVGVGKAAKKLVPELIKVADSFISDDLPVLLDSAMSLLEGVGGSLLDNADKIFESGTAIIDRLLSAITDSNALSTVAEKAGEVFGKFADWVSQNPDKLAETATAIVTAITTLLGDPNLYSNAGKILTALVMAITDPKLLTATITGLDAIAEAIGRGVAEAAAGFEAAAPDIISNLLLALTNYSKDHPINIMDLLTFLFAPLAYMPLKEGRVFFESFFPKREELKEMRDEAWENLKSVWAEKVENPFVEWVTNMYANWSKAMEEWDTFDNLFDGIDGFFDNIETWFASNPIGTWFEELGANASYSLDEISGSLSEFFASLGEFFSDVGADISESWGATWQWVSEITTEIWTDISTFASSIWQTISDAISKPIDDAKTAIGNALDWITNKFDAIGTKAYNWGSDMITNFWNGIKSAWDWVKNSISGVAEWISGIFHHSTPDFGPLKNDDEWMPDMMKQFAKGIRDNAALVQGEFAKATAFDRPDVTQAISYVSGSGESQEEILADLRRVLNRLGAIDQGTLVGMVTPGIDVALGKRQQLAGRYTA